MSKIDPKALVTNEILNETLNETLNDVVDTLLRGMDNDEKTGRFANNKS